jgi:uncharacterized protein YceH (UPF0502 family)
MSRTAGRSFCGTGELGAQQQRTPGTHDFSAAGCGLVCAMELTSEEGRVLGCLVEKQLTTPQLYPLTENALIAACNQTTNREPVVAYDVSAVRVTARSLREKGLLRMVHRTGERSDKHQHLLDTSLALPVGQLTLLAVLLLRGPQTLAELRARSERDAPVRHDRAGAGGT